MKLGAAPEIDRHTLQLSEACPAVATSLRVMITFLYYPLDRGRGAGARARARAAARGARGGAAPAAYACVNPVQTPACQPGVPQSCFMERKLRRLRSSKANSNTQHTHAYRGTLVLGVDIQI